MNKKLWCYKWFQRNLPFLISNSKVWLKVQFNNFILLLMLVCCCEKWSYSTVELTGSCQGDLIIISVSKKTGQEKDITKIRTWTTSFLSEKSNVSLQISRKRTCFWAQIFCTLWFLIAGHGETQEQKMMTHVSQMNHWGSAAMMDVFLWSSKVFVALKRYL